MIPKRNNAHPIRIVDVQNDFIFGSLKAHNAQKIIDPLNAAIKIAEARGMLIIFTRDWHPKDHFTFRDWPVHCVQGSPGAEFPKELYIPPNNAIIDIGFSNAVKDYTPFENNAMKALFSSPNIGTVYVAGIALEYCIQATCLGALYTARQDEERDGHQVDADKKRRVVAIEELIASASDNYDHLENIWAILTEEGVVRERNVPQILKRP